MVVPMSVSIMFSNLPYLRRPALMASMQPGLGWQDEIEGMLVVESLEELLHQFMSSGVRLFHCRRGAEVTLVAGPVSLSCSEAIHRIDVESCESLKLQNYGTKLQTKIMV